MYSEAAQAPEVVREQLQANAARVAQLAARLHAQPPRAVVTCARGSSDHAATFARYLIETRIGLLTSSAAPSVSSVYDAAPDLEGSMMLAISQSGASPDLLAAKEKDAGLLVERLGFLQDGRAAEFTQSFYRGDIYDFVAELSIAT